MFPKRKFEKEGKKYDEEDKKGQNHRTQDSSQTRDRANANKLYAVD